MHASCRSAGSVPEEVTKAAVFLAYDDSSYITGTELFVMAVSHKCMSLIRSGMASSHRVVLV